MLIETHAPPLCGRSDARGFTLVELVLVVALIALVSKIALSDTAPSAQNRVDAAAMEVAQALRFAQQEAIRTGAARVAILDPGSSHVRVFQLDMTAVPPVEDTARPVAYPVSRQQAYDVPLLSLPATAGVKIASAAFTFADGSSATQVAFDATGAPANIRGPKPSDAKALSSGAVSVTLSNARRAVYVDAITGRVTLSS